VVEYLDAHQGARTEEDRPVNDPVAPIARAAAIRLAADHGRALTVDVEAALARRGPAQPPERYLDPVSLGSLVVSVATLAWTVYTDLRSKTRSPSRDVLTRTLRVRLVGADAVDAATRDQVIEVVADETIRTGQNPDDQDVSLALGDGQRAVELLDRICALYDAVFSQPPFRWTDEESAHHRQSLMELSRNPTFGLASAEAGDELVGFAYGVRLPPTTEWWRGFREPLPADLVAEYEGRTFALIDLAVAEAYRGQGLGRRLLDLLLGSRSEERATLCVQPTATETQAIYGHLGWQRVGRKEAAADAVSPLWDVFVLPLHAKP
jgi:ribosomal protein S18 acetylase RimI-like enzyme